MKGVFKMLKKMKALFREEEGQGMTEYALVVAVIAVAVIAVLAIFRTQITNLITKIGDTLSNAAS